MKKIIFILLIYILLIPIGIKAETKYLYDVLKNEAESNGLAKEYTGEHHDSFTEDPTHKIYHWYANNNDEGNQVLEKNNVLFANHCWQMIRTTDTGGVRLIYNGEQNEGKCLSSRGNHVGYSTYTTITLDSSYYYGTDYEYNEDENNFSISGSLSTGEIKIGEYTCKEKNANQRCETLYYIESVNNSNNYNVLTINNNSVIANYGTIPFTTNISLAHSGYMYNKIYNPSVKTYYTTISDIVRSEKYNNNYWYAETIGWDDENKKYYLVNPYQITESDYENMNGMYTLKSSNNNTKSSSAYYISNPKHSNSSYYNYFTLTQGNDIDYYNYTLTYGNSYIENNDGTYTIENPTTFEIKDWPSNYSKLKKYACKNAINNTCSEIWYIDLSNSTNYSYLSSVNGMVSYADDFVYENGHYKLTGDTTTFWDIHKQQNMNKLQNHHYTCLSQQTECEKLNYVFFYDYYWYDRYRYITLENGTSIEDAINEMLYNDDVNNNNSTIKNGIDAWYKKYLKEFEAYIEDSVYCQSKEIRSYNGWHNGGNITKMLYFGKGNVAISTDLKCKNETDQYSMNNPKAKLKYPIALLSAEEANIMNISKIGYAPTNYWLLTPDYYYQNNNNTFYVVSNYSKDIATKSGMSSNGLRPVISLKPNIKYQKGNGSTENPYVIDLKNNYRINITIKNETKDLDINIDDITGVPEGEKVTFNITPVDGYKLSGIQVVDSNNNEIEYTLINNEYTFTMPSSDVVIIPSYVRNKFTINVQIKNETQKLDIMVDNVSKVLEGELVSFKVTPIEGYQVNEIQIIDSNNHEINYEETLNNDEYIFTMPSSDITIIPTYKKVSNSILIDENEHTEEIRIQVNDITMVVYEEEVVFTVIPEKGYEVVNIEIKDEKDNEIEYEKTENEHEYRFVMPSTNVTIKPIYQKKSSSINTDENEFTKEIIIEVNDATAVVYENQVRFTVVPEEGYEVESILIVDEDENQIEYQTTSTKNEYTFIMPATNVLITPVYKRIDNSIDLGNPKTSNPKKNVWIISSLVILFLIYISKKRRKECK